MADSSISSEILGQLMLMQSSVFLLTEIDSKIDLMIHGLEQLPGVKGASFSFEEQSLDQGSEPLVFPVNYRDQNHGVFLLELTSRETLTPYIPFIENLMNMLGVIFEESEQRLRFSQLNEELEDRVEQGIRDLTEIIELAPVGIAITDLQGNIHKLNAKFITLFGYSQKDIRSIDEWILQAYPNEDYRDEILPIWNRDMQNAINLETQTPTREFIVCCKNGSIKNVEITAKPGKEKILIVFNDVTERNENREKLRQGQKMQIIGQLAGGIAHDFNNMLGGIIGSTELLQERIADDEISMGYASMIMEAADHASNLASKLLTFSRRQKITVKPIELHKVIRDCSLLLQNTIKKTVNIVLKLDAEISMIKGDSTQLQSAIMNLAINASQAMPEGGDFIISTTNEEIAPVFSGITVDTLSPGKYIKIEVRDTGLGIGEDDLVHVFEPFFTTKAPGKGTGLGLAAVYGIIQQHRGKIEITSQLGKGTTFYIFLPLA